MIFSNQIIFVFFKELKEELTKIIKEQIDLSNLFNPENKIKEKKKI